MSAIEGTGGTAIMDIIGIIATGITVTSVAGAIAAGAAVATAGAALRIADRVAATGGRVVAEAADSRPEKGN